MKIVDVSMLITTVISNGCVQRTLVTYLFLCTRINYTHSASLSVIDHKMCLFKTIFNFQQNTVMILFAILFSQLLKYALCGKLLLLIAGKFFLGILQFISIYCTIYRVTMTNFTIQLVQIIHCFILIQKVALHKCV